MIFTVDILGLTQSSLLVSIVSNAQKDYENLHSPPMAMV